jgi:nicotinamidase-related amidase
MYKTIFSLAPKNKKRNQNCEAVAATCCGNKKKRCPIINNIDAHYPQDVEVVRKWGNHAIKGTEGAQVIAELNPTKQKITSLRNGPTVASLGRNIAVLVKKLNSC